MTIATDLATARDTIVADAALLDAIVNGPASGTDSLVATDGGPVKTLARIAAEAAALSLLPTWSFQVPAIPVVTAGAYSAGDIMGGLLQFDLVAPGNDAGFTLQEVQFCFKSAVTPSLLMVFLSADPTSTTKTDNAPYSLNVADAFKVMASLPINALGGYLTDHGTPNTIRLGNLAIPMRPVSGTQKIYALLVDLTGVTLGTVSDLQVTVKGF